MAPCEFCRGKGKVNWAGQTIRCPFCFGTGLCDTAQPDSYACDRDLQVQEPRF